MVISYLIINLKEIYTTYQFKLKLLLHINYNTIILYKLNVWPSIN